MGVTDEQKKQETALSKSKSIEVELPMMEALKGSLTANELNQTPDEEKTKLISELAQTLFKGNNNTTWLNKNMYVAIYSRESPFYVNVYSTKDSPKLILEKRNIITASMLVQNKSICYFTSKRERVIELYNYGLMQTHKIRINQGNRKCSHSLEYQGFLIYVFKEDKQMNYIEVFKIISNDLGLFELTAVDEDYFVNDRHFDRRIKLFIDVYHCK